jgi:hypothetical protein
MISGLKAGFDELGMSSVFRSSAEPRLLLNV